MAKGKYVKRRDHGGKATARMVLILAALLLFMGSMLIFKACQKTEIPGEESTASTEKKPSFWNPFKDTEETTEPTTEPTTLPPMDPTIETNIPDPEVDATTVPDMTEETTEIIDNSDAGNTTRMRMK